MTIIGLMCGAIAYGQARIAAYETNKKIKAIRFIACVMFSIAGYFYLSINIDY